MLAVHEDGAVLLLDRAVDEVEHVVKDGRDVLTRCVEQVELQVVEAVWEVVGADHARAVDDGGDALGGELGLVARRVLRADQQLPGQHRRQLVIELQDHPTLRLCARSRARRRTATHHVG